MRRSPSTSQGERIGLLGVVGALAIALAAGGSWVMGELRSREHRHHDDLAAPGALKTIATAQVLLVQRDRDAGGPGRVAASLAELQEAGLIERDLASGTRRGYVFQLEATPDGRDWMATASPVLPGTTGARWFAITSESRLYRADAPIPLDPGAPLPPGAEPVGAPTPGTASVGSR